jgi:CRISPR-associated protein Csm1
MSGIQNFIYTIRSEGALKSLRGRSFYLEIMMEHLADTLLESLGLSRANLLYSGGGHFYMLLPNTAGAKKRIEQFENETNTWLIGNFRTALYVAGGYAPCSKNTLENEPTGSYAALYRTASGIISEKKMHRYTKEQIIALNGIRQEGRECRTCKLVFADSGKDGEGKDCPLCESMKALSDGVVGADFFAILKGDAECRARLPGGMYIEPLKDEAKAREMQTDNDSFVRIYGKNRYYRGKGVRTRLWVGSYSKESELGKYAEREWTRVVQEDGSRGAAAGIKRLGVLRMDVDNLGEAFVTGFSKADPKYNTISRTAAFSRQLSMFFKHDINSILSEKNRKATIIYSGGDDVFLIGAWDDVIGFAADLRTQFGLFSQGKLTLSAGIGLYPGKFPVHVMARETGELEDFAKQNTSPVKDSVVLFGKNERYGWDDYIKDVKEEKYETVKAFFDSSDERGNAFLYKLVDLIRDRKKKISLARWVYLLARLEPPNGDTAKRDAFRVFAEKLKTWFDDDEDARKLATALQLYVYKNRKGGD